MVKTKIACPCGMETHLVMLDGKWRYDVDKHGNGELAEGKCFNCRAPLKIENDEPADPPETVDERPKAVSEMTKKELYEHAKELGLKVSWTTSTAKIVEIIEAGKDEQQETAKDEQPEDRGQKTEDADNGE